MFANKLIVTFISFLFLTACNGGNLIKSDGSIAPERWVFISADGISSSAAFKPDITFRDNSVHGALGCNGFSAKYKISGKNLKISDGVITSKACSPLIIMQNEQKFQGMLFSVERYEINATTLTLVTSDGKNIRMRAYVPAAKLPVENTQWRLSSIAGIPGIPNSDAMVGTSENLQKTSLVMRSGKLQVTDGCYSLQAKYVLNNENLVFDDIFLNQTGCNDKEALMNAQNLVEKLKRTSRLEQNERQMSFRDKKKFLLDMSPEK